MLATRAIVFSAAFLAFAPAQAIAADNPMGFALDVSLSRAAATKLASTKEGIEIAAYWYGEPTKAAKKRADDMGNINLGQEKARLPGTGGRAEISGKGAKVKDVGLTQGGAVKVNLNVYSARLGNKDNILDCSFFDDDLKLARLKPIAVLCKLIGEK